MHLYEHSVHGRHPQKHSMDDIPNNISTKKQTTLPTDGQQHLAAPQLHGSLRAFVLVTLRDLLEGDLLGLRKPLLDVAPLFHLLRQLLGLVPPTLAILARRRSALAIRRRRSAPSTIRRPSTVRRRRGSLPLAFLGRLSDDEATGRHGGFGEGLEK